MDCPRHLVLLLVLLLLSIFARAASTVGTSSDSSESGTLRAPLRDVTPAPEPSVKLSPDHQSRRAAGHPSPAEMPPCDPDRRANQVSESCPRDVVPAAPCCGLLLAAGESVECFCSMLDTGVINVSDLTWRAVAEMYYQCGGRHNVSDC
ncbi:hypothetical protein ACP70R_025107 [Stipagrostis hirtigluma subsp. patula]